MIIIESFNCANCFNSSVTVQLSKLCLFIFIMACRNVEIKARLLDDISDVNTKAEELSGVPGSKLQQTDIFYITPKGRLKWRTIKMVDGSCKEELIYYEREDASGPKLCNYYKVDGGSSLHPLLEACLGVRGQVVKERTLHLVDQTRVHVDCVQGLGSFLELEVVLEEGQSPAEGEVIAEAIMKQLGIRRDQLLLGAYMDLIEAKTNM